MTTPPLTTASRLDPLFLVISALGLLVGLLPELPFHLASDFWRAVTGKVDVFELRALYTSLSVQAALTGATLGRVLFLYFRRSPKTVIRAVFHWISALQVIGTAVSWTVIW